MSQRGSAFAPVNIALIKYWGKRDTNLNLPFVDTLSVSLDRLGTLSVVERHADLDEDVIVLDGALLEGSEATAARRVLDGVRARAGIDERVGATSVSTVPVGHGLASSASGMAALAGAACAAFDLDLPASELSVLARLGSGSAARSVAGGFALWRRGELADGSDSYAVELHPPEHWPLTALVVHVHGGRKRVGSREGMARTVRTSPYLQAWLEACRRDLAAALPLVAARDLRGLAPVVQGNALAMHAAAQAARPPVRYLTDATWEVIARVERAQAQGAACLYTMDAGAAVVVLCEPDDAVNVLRELADAPGVRDITRTGLCGGVRLIEPDAVEP
jgi:diphosphomevalonate decarboxylase